MIEDYDRQLALQNVDPAERNTQGGQDAVLQDYYQRMLQNKY